MEAAPDIALIRLFFGFGLLIAPVVLSLLLRLGILRQLFVSVGRMTAQLFLVSILLIYLFDWDNAWLNVTWVMIMIVFACLSAISNSRLSYQKFFLPVFFAYFIGAGSVLLFFNAVIVNPNNLFTAQLLVVVGGMLLGNSLNSIIIGISRYYESLYKDYKQYLFGLSLGATQWEALRPFIREAMLAALRPFLANMATMGVVFLPGMMTGQILGGASPETAIKYQVALAIFAAVAMSVSLSLYFTSRKGFDAYGVMKPGLFRNDK